MQDFSILDKFKILMNVIVSSPFYIGLIFVLIIVLIVFLISTKLNKKINSWIYIGIWAAFFLVLIIIYRNFMLNLIDNLFDNVFMALYFPNLATYIITLLVTNFFFVYSIFNKKIQKAFKVLNITNTILIDLLLIFIIGIVSQNNINVYEELTVYSNSTLLVLLELTSAFFTAWLLLNLFTSAYYKLKKYDSNDVVVKEQNGPDIIFDWVK